MKNKNTSNTLNYVNRYLAGEPAWARLLKMHARVDRPLLVDHVNELIDSTPEWQRALARGQTAYVIASVRSTLTMGASY
jgi:hypothetical protein